MDDKKNKITIRISDETLRKCEEGMRISDCKVRNDFIERAIEFYSGYVSSKTHTDFLSDVILESMAGIVKTSENHLARLLFKIAVERQSWKVCLLLSMIWMRQLCEDFISDASMK